MASNCNRDAESVFGGYWAVAQHLQWVMIVEAVVAVVGALVALVVLGAVVPVALVALVAVGGRVLGIGTPRLVD